MAGALFERREEIGWSWLEGEFHRPPKTPFYQRASDFRQGWGAWLGAGLEETKTAWGS